jgi:ABC-type phosphate transport system substrate-binding protein
VKQMMCLTLLAVGVLVVGCGQGEVQTDELAGMVSVDGSSTVFPITEAVAEEFQKVNPKVRVAGPIPDLRVRFALRRRYCTTTLQPIVGC